MKFTQNLKIGGVPITPEVAVQETHNIFEGIVRQKNETPKQ